MRMYRYRQMCPRWCAICKQRGWHTAVVGKTHWTSHFQTSDLRENKPLLKQLGFDQACEVAGPRALRRVTCDLTEAWRKICWRQRWKI